MRNGLPDKCADLIIADPPYFRTRGEFDYAWGYDFNAYLAQCEQWGEECRRLLSNNGTLMWYGSDQYIAYIQVMFDKKFRYLNNCTIAISNNVSSFFSKEKQRSFFPNINRFLLYAANPEEVDNHRVKARNAHRYMQGMCHTQRVRPIVDYLRGEIARAGFTPRDIDAAFHIYAPSRHWFAHHSQFHPPTAEWYEKLRQLLNDGNADGEYLRKPYEELRREYEELRSEYEGLRSEYEWLRRPFNLAERMTDVIRCSINSGDSKRYGHPTVKPLRLTETLISTTTRDDALVIVPFAGSGTECVAAAKLGRRFVGYEIDEKYCEGARRRVAEIDSNLFNSR